MDGVVAVALESVGAADASGATDEALLGLVVVEVVAALAHLRESGGSPTTTASTPSTAIWTIGLSFSAFLMRSPGAAARK